MKTTCVKHGDASLYELNGKTTCRICRNERLAQWRAALKQELVTAAGGACRCCGYNRCASALHFHHVDPSEKNFEVNVGSSRNKVELLQEMALCALVCANCHAEIHGGERATPAPIDKPFLEQTIRAELDRKQPRQVKCFDCGNLVPRTRRRCKSCSRRNREKIEWPDDDDLLAMGDNSSCYRVSIELGVSNNAVKKRLNRINNNKDA